MNSGMFLCVLVTLFSQALPEPGVDAAEVRRLVRQLNANTVQERDAAEAAIIALGPDVLPLLPSDEALKTAPPETALRVSRIRQTLQKLVILYTLQPAAVPISAIPAGEKTPEAWLAWLETETGNPLRPAENAAEKPFSLEFQPAEGDSGDKIPFWLLLDRIADSAGLSPQFRRQTTEIYFSPGTRTLPRTGISPQNSPETPSNGNVTYAGPFRVAPTKITSTILLERNISAAQIQTEIAWEPRLMPIYLNMQITKVTANVGLQNMDYLRGRGILPFSPRDFNSSRGPDPRLALELLPRTHEVPVGDVMIAAELDLPLTLKNATHWEIFRRADSLAVEGKLSAVVAGPQHPFTFTDLPRKLGRRFPPESERVAGVLVTFTGLRRDTHALPENPEQKGNVFVAAMRYRYEKTHDAMSSHRTWLYRNPAWLESPDGTKIASTHYEILRQSTNEISLELYFPDGGEDLTQWKLVFPRPTGLYAVEYDFLMRDVPCP